ncbi:MAG TPA: hypothetical protein G4O07_04870 [Dehalococcoidia bacterium]|nr:hypothetical protein [Dehalococcoidia bacterium]
MDKAVSEALGEFFSGQKKLNQLGVINSRDYIGDIGRYLCQQVYGMEVPRGRPQPGYDGTIGPSRVAVRMNNCPTGTPVRVNEPFEFDELIVVLGPNCFLRPDGVASDFIFYRFTPDETRERFKATNGGYIAGRQVFDRSYDKTLNIAAF